MFRTILLLLISLFPFSGLMSQDAGAIVLQQEHHIRVQDKRWIRQASVDVQITQRKGETYTKVSIPYSGDQRISKIRAEIIDPLGNIVKTLRQQDITDRHYPSEESLYEDKYLKEFTLKHNQYPYRLKYSYEISGTGHLILDWWHPLLTLEIPCREATLSIDIPEDFPILYRSRGVQLITADTLEGRIRVRWQSSYPEVLHEEFASPPLIDNLPYVHIIPLEISYGANGSQESWASFGKWVAKLNEDLEVLSPREQAVIQSRIKDSTELESKVRSLYHYLQDQTRYVNVSIGIGGLKSFPAAYVADRNYGDCKALTTYMKAMLAVAGIPSYRALVQSGISIPRLDTGFPSQQFDHVILCVPNGSDTLWLDCTSNEAFGYAGCFIQNRVALVVEHDSGYLTRIPAFSDAQLTNLRLARVQWTGSGNLSELTIEQQFRGKEYSLFHGLSREAREDTRDSYLQEYFSEMDLSLEQYTLKPEHRDSSFIRLSCTANSNYLFRKYGNELVLGILPFFNFKLETPAKRKLPVQFDFPVIKKDSLVYSIPPGYRLGSLPENFKTETRFGSYCIQYDPSGSSLSITKTVRLNAGTIDPGQYSSFYTFIDQILNYEVFTRIPLIEIQN